MVLALLVLLQTGARAGGESRTDAVMALGTLRVLNPRSPVPIGNALMSFDVGDRVKLFQENSEFFIALVDTSYGGRRLCAFPLRKGGWRVAWITPEYDMFFGDRTFSTDGRFYLRMAETLPVIRESDTSYEVLVERLGIQVSLWIPKDTNSFEFVPSSIASTVGREDGNAVGGATSSIADTARSESSATRRVSGSAAPQKVAPIGSQGPATAHPVKPPSEVEDALISLLDPTTDEWAVAERPIAEPVPGAPFATDQVMAELVDKVLSVFRQGVSILVLLVLASVFLLALLVVGLRKAVLRRSHPASALRRVDRSEPPPPPQSDAGTGDAQPAAAAADFSGSIGSMALGAVTQFLNSDKETGRLVISGSGRNELGSMIFVNGEIVDAKTDGKRGVDAVYEMLALKDGVFAFTRQPEDSAARTVGVGTISLLLEAHRVMDEAGSQDAPAGVPEPPAPAGRKEKAAAALHVKRRATR